MRCGTDICSVERMKETIEKLGDNFLRKVFTKNEIDYCERFKMSKYEKYAARFAGKEAVYKAISPSKNEDGVFTEVEILNAENGRPIAIISGGLKESAGKIQIDVSLSHEKDYAIAFCIAY